MSARGSWRILASVGTPLFVLVACSGSTVARFAPCDVASDTCPTATTCEAPLGVTSPSVAATVCTWTCDDFDEKCPNDANGAPGECIAGIGGIPVSSGGGSLGFCFQGCNDGSPCPDGSLCVDANGIDALSNTKVCFPVPSDPLTGTTWESDKVTATAASNGVQSSTYTLTFGPQTGFAVGAAQGSLTATLVQVYDTSPFHPYAGCTETTTYSGGTWNDIPPGTQPGNLTILNMTSLTERVGCVSNVADVSGEADDYPISEGTAGYYFSGTTTMNLGGEYGAVPYPDPVEWTFTKQ